MPLNPSIFNQLDTEAPARLAELFNPIRRDEQRNSLADLANQRELRSQQVTQGRQELAAYPAQQDAAKRKALFEQQTQIGGVLTKLQQSIAMGNVSDEAIKQQAMQAKQYGIPDAVIQQTFGSYLQTPAEQRAALAQGHVTDYNKWYEVNNPKPNMHVIETPTGQQAVNLNDPNAPKSWGAKPSSKSTPMAPVAYVNDKGETIWGTITEAKGRPAANYSPSVQGQVAGAKASGKETGQSVGESEARLKDMESMMPRLEVVTKELSDLGKKATYTMAGQGANIVRRQLGMDVGEGAVARKEYISKVDNEILPLLRQTFGAQFTQKEGESLKATLGDTNASPEEKDAVLKSFIQTKYGQIAALQRRTGAQQSGAYDADKEARYQAWKAQQGR